MRENRTRKLNNSQLWLMVTNAYLLENVHHVKLNSFLDDLSGFYESDVHESDGDSLSCSNDSLILSSVSAMHSHVTRDLIALSDLVFHNSFDVGES